MDAVRSRFEGRLENAKNIFANIELENEVRRQSCWLELTGF
jgi:hypothetical protein